MMSTSVPLTITCAGVLTLVLGAALTGHIRESLRCALDLWFAAGAIRLGASPGMHAIVIAAVILGLRELIGWRFFGYDEFNSRSTDENPTKV